MGTCRPPRTARTAHGSGGDAIRSPPSSNAPGAYPLPEGARAIPEGARNFVRAKLTGDPRVRVRDYVKMPRTIQTIDKVSFTLGVVGLMLTQFVATEHPEYFWFYYLCSAPLVFIYRIIMYRMIKYHYFLIDFCYYANLACFVHILGARTSGRLFGPSLRTATARYSGPHPCGATR